MNRTARCLCGEFRAIAEGEPFFTNICHCEDCQRRSGNPWAMNVYFRQEQVRLEGPSQEHSRAAAAGRWVKHQFCPSCGTTLCWTVERIPGGIGIAGGAFTDPAFPPPTVSIWENHRYDWVPSVPGVEHYGQGMSAVPRAE